MVRVKRGFVARRKRKKARKKAKGFRGSLRTLTRRRHQALIKAGVHATVDRRKKKRTARNLWIVRINAAARELGISYSKLIAGLKKAKIVLDRRSLADLAMNDPKAFTKIVEVAKA